MWLRYDIPVQGFGKRLINLDTIKEIKRERYVIKILFNDELETEVDQVYKDNEQAEYMLNSIAEAISSGLRLWDEEQAYQKWREIEEQSAGHRNGRGGEELKSSDPEKSAVKSGFLLCDACVWGVMRYEV